MVQNDYMFNGLFRLTIKETSKLRIMNTLRSKQNGRRFSDDNSKSILLNEICISIQIPLKYVSNGPLDNKPAVVQIMAGRRSGDKSLSEPKVA